MSIISSFTKRPTLDAAIKQVAQARKSEGGKAEQLYKGAYQGFASVVAGHAILSEALYYWGFALLHEAATQPADLAKKTLEEAIIKFTFCLLSAPHYLGAAIDGGVAYLELARISSDEDKAKLYVLAQECFEQADSIQKGSAAYNLACIFAIKGDDSACESALRLAKEYGSLPDEKNILADADMANIVSAEWFKAFLEEVRLTPETNSKKKEPVIDYTQSKFKLKKSEDFEYYSK